MLLLVQCVSREDQHRPIQCRLPQEGYHDGGTTAIDRGSSLYEQVHDTLGGFRIVEPVRDSVCSVVLVRAPSASERTPARLMDRPKPGAGVSGSESCPPIVSSTRTSTFTKSVSSGGVDEPVIHSLGRNTGVTTKRTYKKTGRQEKPLPARCGYDLPNRSLRINNRR